MGQAKQMSSELKGIVDTLEAGKFGLTESQFTEVLKWSGEQHATIIVDMDTQTILRATPGAELMFGYVTDELNDQPLEVLLPNAVRAAHNQHVQDFNANPSKRSMGKRGMELHGKKRSGEEFRVEISLLPRVFAGHRIVVANLVSLDKGED